jgi:hypothetical protein
MKLSLISRATMRTVVATNPHELGSRNRHPYRDIAMLLSHSNETPDRKSTSRTNQTPRLNLDRRRYGSAMQIPAMPHGTVDQEGSICVPEKKLEEFAKVQTRWPSVSDGTGLCCLGGTVEAGEVFGISRRFLATEW